MATLLHNLTLVNNDNFIGILNGTQSVSDNHRGTPLQQLIQRILNELLALGIKSRGRLVKDKYIGVFQHRTGNAQTLTLTAREFRSTISDICVVALRTLHNKVVRICHLARLNNLLVGSVTTTKHYVALYRVVEENGLLRHKAHRRAQRILLIVVYRDSVNKNFAGISVVESLHQLAQCRLSSTRRAYQSHRFALTHLKRHTANNLARLVVGEAHIAELNLIIEALELLCIGRVNNLVLTIKQCEDTLARRYTLIDACELVNKGANRSCNLREGGDKGDKACGTQRPLHHKRAAEYQDNSHRRNAEELAHWRCQLLTTSHPKQDF